MGTSLPWRPTLPSKLSPFPHSQRKSLRPLPQRPMNVEAFRRSDFDGFAKRMASGEALKDAWRTANYGLESILFEAKKTAERIDRQYAVSRRVSDVRQAAADYAREFDRDLELRRRWRTFSLDLSRNWPKYGRQLNDFFDTPLGRSFATIFFIWFALSGWLFRCLIFATWMLPLAGPLLIGTLANNLVIRGACPACRRQFIGYKNQVVNCPGCGNIVWQPKGSGSSKRGPSGFPPEIIDVEFEEK